MSRIVFRVHALQRMFERSISIEEVRHVLVQGETIEEYPSDSPYPSSLVLGRTASRTLHVVVAFNQAADELIVITVYEPDAEKWDSELKRRNP